MKWFVRLLQNVNLLAKKPDPIVLTQQAWNWGTVPMTDKQLREWCMQLIVRTHASPVMISLGIDPMTVMQAPLNVHALAQVRRWAGIPRPDIEEHRPKWSDVDEIRIDALGTTFRVFPHWVDDDLLALRALPKTASYVKLPDGRFRFKPDGFVMPAYLPDEVKASIEETFIVTGDELVTAQALFEAYENGSFKHVK